VHWLAPFYLLDLPAGKAVVIPLQTLPLVVIQDLALV